MKIKMNAWNCHIIYMDFIVIFTRYRMVDGAAGTLLSHSFLECFHIISRRTPFKNMIAQFFLFIFLVRYSITICHFLFIYASYVRVECANACTTKEINVMVSAHNTTSSTWRSQMLDELSKDTNNHNNDNNRFTILCDFQSVEFHEATERMTKENP